MSGNSEYQSLNLNTSNVKVKLGLKYDYITETEAFKYI